MKMDEIMKQKVFAVVGDTLNPNKYACIIKNRLLESGYQAYGVYKEIPSLNDIDEEIDIIDLCINPIKGLEIMKENKKKFKCIVIQPGAESEELLNYLTQQKMDYIEGCILVGISLYGRNK